MCWKFSLNVCKLFSPFWTLSQSRKISSPPKTVPHVLSIRDIFRLEAFGDSAGKTQSAWWLLMYLRADGCWLTAVVDGVGHNRLQGSGESSVTVLQEGGELQPNDVQVHDLAQLLGLLHQAVFFCLWWRHTSVSNRLLQQLSQGITFFCAWWNTSNKSSFS